MRKNLLALSIAAMVGGLSGAANAAVFGNTGTNVGGFPVGLVAPGAAAATNLAPTVTGVGHILVVPYFTTQGTNATLLNLINTDETNGKAVKLRFRGASNSDDIFDITIFLSPGDMWTANVSANGELSALTTTDNSCTLPSKADIQSQNGLFKIGRVLGGAAAQTREGYIEILNMADVPPGTGPLGANSALYTAIKHVPDASGVGVAPCTAATMNAQAADLVVAAGANNPVTRGYSWPTGGLTANWTIVNLADKASFSGEAVAIRANTAAGASGVGNLVFFPQTPDNPSFATSAAGAAGFTADPLLQSAGFAALVANYDFPDLSTPYVSTAAINAAATAAQAQGLADTLATLSVTNEYLTGTVADFATDWVFSMPTRRYAVAMNYTATGAARILQNVAVNRNFWTGTSGGFAVAPVPVDALGDLRTINTSLSTDGTQLCVTPGAPMRAYDAEENTKNTFVISPDVALRFCGETSVLSFNATASQVLGAKLAASTIKVGFAAGWHTIGLRSAHQPVAPLAGVVYGLPVVGYAAAKAKGVNLGGTWAHRTSGR